MKFVLPSAEQERLTQVEPIGIFAREGAMGNLHFALSHLSGLDWLASLVLSPTLYHHWLARRITRHLRARGADLDTLTVTFSVPHSRSALEIYFDSRKRVRVRPWSRRES